VDSWPGQINVNVLAGPMKELNLYFDHISELKWESEKLKIKSRGEALVHRYFKFLLRQNYRANGAAAKNGQKEDKSEVNKLTPFDWFLILESILLLSYNQHFCETFGQIKSEFSVRLQLAFKRMDDPTSTCPTCGKVCKSFDSAGFKCEPCRVIHVDVFPSRCRIHDDMDESSYDCLTNRFSCCPRFTYCKHVTSLSCLQRKYDTLGSLVPTLSEIHARWANVIIPKSLSDENHFGHLPYEFCRLMERMS
jgi:hypothetical protein